MNMICIPISDLVIFVLRAHEAKGMRRNERENER